MLGVWVLGVTQVLVVLFPFSSLPGCGDVTFVHGSWLEGAHSWPEMLENNSYRAFTAPFMREQESDPIS